MIIKPIKYTTENNVVKQQWVLGLNGVVFAPCSTLPVRVENLFCRNDVAKIDSLVALYKHEYVGLAFNRDHYGLALCLDLTWERGVSIETPFFEDKSVSGYRVTNLIHIATNMAYKLPGSANDSIRFSASIQATTSSCPDEKQYRLAGIDLSVVNNHAVEVGKTLNEPVEQEDPMVVMMRNHGIDYPSD